MAAQASRRLPEAHQATQSAIVDAMKPVLTPVWDLVDLSDLSGSVPRFTAALSAVLRRYGMAAVAASNRFYRMSRSASGIHGSAPRIAYKAPSEVAVDQLVVDAVSSAIAGGPDLGERTLGIEAEQLVQDQARRQVMSLARLDREARGWARTVEPGACSFCLMLAMRGAVYGSKSTANFRAHKKQPNGSGGDCRCHAEPVFGVWEPQASVRAAKELWAETNGGGKHSGHDARVAFRQAVEGRKVTGAKSAKGAPHGKDHKGRPYVPVTSTRTRQSEEHQLQVLIALPPAKTPEAAKWQADRIAEIRKWLSENK